MPISAVTETDFRARTHDEAAKAFRRKLVLTSDEFEALAVEQRRFAFRVATVNNARLIQSVSNRLATAIKQGRPFRDFRAELLKLFTAADVPPPAMHRIKFLFRQNTLQAYSDARREVLDRPEIAEAFPYRQYLTVGNGTPDYKNVRYEHAVLHGLVFRWNDPFWDLHTPPWGPGCRCTDRAMTEREVKRRRLKVRGLGYVQRKLKITPHPTFSSSRQGDFDLSGLEAALRAAIEKELK